MNRSWSLAQTQPVPRPIRRIAASDRRCTKADWDEWYGINFGSVLSTYTCATGPTRESDRTHPEGPMKTTTRALLGVAAIATIGCSGLAAAPATACVVAVEEHAVAGVITNADVDTKGELDAFVASSKPKEVTIDSTTGKILEVAATGPSSRAISGPTSTCASSQMCLIHSATPYRDWGFSGTGTKTGSFTNVNKYSTGSASGKVQFSSGAWGAGVGPNTLSLLTSSTTLKGVQRW